MEWMQHDGSSMPVEPKTIVQVKYRDGEISDEIQPAVRWHYCKGCIGLDCSLWIWVGDEHDILEYRLVTTHQSQ